MATKAKESEQIVKARKKIEKRLAKENKQISPKNLKVMSEQIKNYITRHQQERINLKDRSIILFDENHHPAKTENRYVINLLVKLKKETPAARKLKGRIEPLKPRQ